MAAITEAATEETIQNGFRRCGIFPWNPDNVDFSKCVADLDNPADDNDEATPADAATVVNTDSMEQLIIDELGIDTINKFTEIERNSGNPESQDEKLYRVWCRWKNGGNIRINAPDNRDNANTSNESIQMPVLAAIDMSRSRLQQRILRLLAHKTPFTKGSVLSLAWQTV
jgi:hypothetical protein